MSNSYCLWRRIAMACVLTAAATAAAAGGETFCQHCPGQIIYRDVVSHRCKLVPETKEIKKTVYEVKQVPFCLHKLPPLLGHHGECCDECRECGCVRYKKVLTKKEIVCGEICTTKCVIEEFVERVPCRVCCPDCPTCGKLPTPAAQPSVPLLAEQELVPIPLPRVTR